MTSTLLFGCLSRVDWLKPDKAAADTVNILWFSLSFMHLYAFLRFSPLAYKAYAVTWEGLCECLRSARKTKAVAVAPPAVATPLNVPVPVIVQVPTYAGSAARVPDSTNPAGMSGMSSNGVPTTGVPQPNLSYFVDSEDP